MKIKRHFQFEKSSDYQLGDALGWRGGGQESSSIAIFKHSFNSSSFGKEIVPM